MRLCCSTRADGSKVHLRLLGCSAFVAAWLVLSVAWLRYICLGASHPFQVQALQQCTGQSNRSSFVHSGIGGYQCYGPAESTEAVIVSIYEGLQAEVVEAIRDNRAAYAEQNGYRYCEFNQRVDPTRGASWNKVAAMLLVMHCSEYVMALDSDAVIVNYKTRIKDVFQEHGSDKDILFSTDYGGHSMVNAGSMLVKRTKWSVWFLQNLYNEYRVWQQGGQRGQEQGAINRFAEEVPEVFEQHAGIVPYAVFNQHRLRYEPGTFVAHYAGWDASPIRYARIASELKDPTSLWAEYTQELATSSSSANQSFCTDAMVINAPQRHLVDRLISRFSQGKGFLLLLSRLWVPSSRLGGMPHWPLTASLDDEEFGDALCHRTWNLTVTY